MKLAKSFGLPVPDVDLLNIAGNNVGYNMLGQYYVLSIKFLDILNAIGEEIPTTEQKFVIVENGINDFVLSFQAE